VTNPKTQLPETGQLMLSRRTVPNLGKTRNMDLERSHGGPSFNARRQARQFKCKDAVPKNGYGEASRETRRRKRVQRHLIRWGKGNKGARRVKGAD